MRAHIYPTVAIGYKFLLGSSLRICSPMSASASVLAGLALALSTLQYVGPYFGQSSVERGVVDEGGGFGFPEYGYAVPTVPRPVPSPSLRGSSTPEPCPDPLGRLDGWRFYLAVMLVDPSPTFLVLLAFGGVLYGAFWCLVGWWWRHHSPPSRRRAESRRIEDSAPARLATLGDVRR